MKHLKKLVTGIASAAMVLCFSFGAFAADGNSLVGNAIPPSDSPNCSTYEVGAPNTAASAEVTLVVEAGNAIDAEWGEGTPGTAFRKVVTVNATAAETNEGITVADVLKAADGKNGLSFDITKISGASHEVFLKSITHGNYTWASGNYGFDGWVYRVNDKMPVINMGDDKYQGALINEAPVYDGDVVHFFYDNPSGFDQETTDVSARFVRGKVTGNAADLTVQLQGHRTYITREGGIYIFNVYNYENVNTKLTATLTNASGGTITAESNANGVVDFGNVTPGTYVLQTVAVPFNFPQGSLWSEDYYLDGCYMAYTGAYQIITVQ